MTGPDRTRDGARDLFTAMLGGVGGQSVTVRMATELLASLVARLETMRGADGYAPQNVGELSLLLTVLFGETLTDLKATSIHSSKASLQSYKGYWDDPTLGPLFKDRNQKFLHRGGSMERIFVCDSVAEAVGESWFTTAVLPQVRAGATVRVTELETRRLHDYEDFGIYDHQKHGGRYLLLAPPARNASSVYLQTAIISEYDTVAKYAAKFDSLQTQHKRRHSPVAMLRRDEHDEIPEPGSHGTGTINSIMGGQVVLRRLMRLDTKDSLIADRRIVRKHDGQYATAVFNHIRTSFPEVSTIVYVGDTQRNDGSLVRHLQGKAFDLKAKLAATAARAAPSGETGGAATDAKAGPLSVYGFICEPALQVEGAWLNDVLYTDKWTDLIGFAEVAKDKLGPRMLGIFDIDQTLWAAKGVSDNPLNDLRRAAVSALVERYCEGPRADALVTEIQERVVQLYDNLGAIKYHGALTLDNEDLRAGIAMAMGLNLMRSPDDGRTDPITAGWLERLANRTPAQFARFVVEKYLPRMGTRSGDGWARAEDTIRRATEVCESSAYRVWAEGHGIDLAAVKQDVQGMFSAMHSATAAVQYPEFRRAELEQTLARTDPSLPVDERLVINKPAWDFATWLRDRETPLLALSDRPEEATHPPTGESVLEKDLTIFGASIVELLPEPGAKGL